MRLNEIQNLIIYMNNLGYMEDIRENKVFFNKDNNFGFSIVYRIKQKDFYIEIDIGNNIVHLNKYNYDIFEDMFKKAKKCKRLFK